MTQQLQHKSKIYSLDEIQHQQQALKIQESLAIDAAFHSNDVDTILKAQQYLKNIEKKQQVDVKSIMVDPLDVSSALGYKHKPFNISYQILRGMAKTHIIKSIIETRKEQISDFCTPRDNKNGIGFIVQKKKRYYSYLNDEKQSESDKIENTRISEQITEFLMKCGSINNSWSSDDFDDFIRKIVQDSLVLDQATFEVVRDRQGNVVQFFATDGATFRIADSFFEQQQDTEIVKGYAPSYVQIYNSSIINEYYPWELCFGTRNPSTDIYSNGYGRSELEDMIQTVTAILNSDTYNANFFRVGSAPKGILKYSGNINPNTVEDFRRQWTAQVAGVMNMHKIPMINADKLDFINTGQNNKDMEFSKYQEFLIKVSCAVYKIDPSEIGFPMQGTSQAAGLGGDGGTKEKLKYSRAKGLKPLLRKIEKWINKFIVEQINDKYEFKFVGIDEQDEEDIELERDIRSLSNFMTLNEIRAKRNLSKLDDGDVILNPTYLQAKGMAAMGNEQSNQFVDDEYSDDGDDEQQYEDEGDYINGHQTEQQDEQYSDDDSFKSQLFNDIEKAIIK